MLLVGKAVSPIVEELVVAKKLAPTDVPAPASVINTRCSLLVSIATGVPAVPATASETVNTWLLKFHVPPIVWYVPLPDHVAAEMGVKVRAGRGPRPARMCTAPLLVIVPPATVSRLPSPTSIASSDWLLD